MSWATSLFARALSVAMLLWIAPGCLWLSGTVGAVVATNGSNGGGKKQEPPPPDAAVLDTTRSAGPFQLLDDEPIGIAVGDFVPNEATDDGDVPSHLDTAVIFRSKPRISFFQGDGTGRLSARATFSVRGGNPVALAAVPSRSDGPWSLLIATPKTLELVQWEGTLAAGAFKVAAIRDLGAADPDRDIALGDFNGDGVVDAAVSSALGRSVVFLSIPSGESTFGDLGSLALEGAPRSMTAADFYPDPRHASDLVVLVVKGGQTSLSLYLERRDGNGDWCPEPAASIVLPDDGFVLAKPALPGNGQNLDGGALNVEPIPDVAYTRRDGTGSALVTRLQGDSGALQQGELGGCDDPLQDQWELDLKNRGAGHFSPEAAAISLLHLPGGLPETWDRVTIDSSLDAIVCSYMKCDGTNLHDTFSYPTPGSGRALAVGDLDEDGFDDLVFVTADPDRTTLGALLSNPQIENANCEEFTTPRLGPYFYPHATIAGESPRPVSAVLDVDFGHAGPGEDSPFLAVVDRVNTELVLFFLGLSKDGTGTLDVVSEERYPLSLSQPSSVTVADLDLQDGDDVYVGGDDGFTIFFHRGATADEGSRFEAETNSSEDLRSRSKDPGIQDETWEGLRHVNAAIGPLDSIPVPDLVFCTSTQRPAKEGEAPYDYIVVVLNAGFRDSWFYSVRFYKVPSHSRDVTIANLNDDRAPDLLVASDDSPNVYILFGDPEEPGKFFDNAADPNPPMTFKNLSGVENVATDNSALATQKFPGLAPQWPRARWIITSLPRDIVGFKLGDLQPSPNSPEHFRPEIGAPCVIDEARDPEAILVADLFAHGDGTLDVAVVDESGGKVIFLENRGVSDDPCTVFNVKGRPPEIGSPQRVAPFTLGGNFYLAVASRSEQRVVLLERQGDCSTKDKKDCEFVEVGGIDLPRANVPGSRSGMSVKKSSTGGVLCVQAVEDEPVVDGRVSVDITFLGGKGDLIRLGSAGAVERTKRCALPAAPQRISALLIEDASSSGDTVELLAASGDGEGKTSVSCHRVSLDDAAAPESQKLFDLDGTLVDWEMLPSEGDSSRLWVATSSCVSIYSVSPRHLAPGVPATSIREWQGLKHDSAVEWAAQGWLRSHKDLESDLFFAILMNDQLFVETRSSGGKESSPVSLLPDSKLSCVGVRDLNGDGRDDIVAIDQGASSLHVFLAERGKTGTGPEAGVGFTHEPLVPYGRFVVPVDLAFLNADRDKNIDICFGASTGEVYVFLGNGHGAFSAPRVLYAAPDLEALRIADIDGDGQDEILVSVTSPGLIILSGQGFDENETHAKKEVTILK